MLQFIDEILNNPLYCLLFGGGGILTIIVAVVQMKKKDISSNSIIVKKSKKVRIEDNNLKDKSICVEKSMDTNISGNK
mgnify:CR=1 FL=1